MSSLEESLLSFDSCSIVPLYGYNAHLGNFFFFFLRVSPLADLNENQLMWKACNLKMTSSFPINPRLSQLLFLSSGALWLFILEVTHQKRHKGRVVTLANLHRCECARPSAHSVRFNQGLISWYDSHGKYNKADPAEGKHNYWSAMLLNLKPQIAMHAFSLPLKGTQHKSGEALFFINISPIVLFQHEQHLYKVLFKKLFRALRSHTIKLFCTVCWLVSQILKWSHPDWNLVVQTELVR